jgi:spore coat protein H
MSLRWIPSGFGWKAAAGVTMWALAVGCGGGGDNGGAGSGAPALMEGWGSATPLGGTGVLTYAFAVDPADLDRLNATALQETYVPANLTVSGKPVGQVGLRYKGSDGTLGACFDQGVRLCPKLSFKVKFDFMDPERRLEGLKRLNLHSMLGDASLMHERLAYELFRRMDIAGPRSTHAFVTINGVAQGLFGTVEDLDGRFTKDRWKEAGDGNLYKEAWPLEVNADEYTPFLNTNEQMPDNQLMVMFTKGLYAAKAPELTSVVNRFADTDQLLRYLAVDQAINNYDGVTAFYCDNTGKECTNHNFFWYQHPTSSRFLLVPWDLTDTFWVSTPFDDVPAWNVLPADCGMRSLVEGSAVARAGCDLVFQGIAGAGRAAYDQALDKMLQIFDVAELAALIDQWAAEIAPAVALDPLGNGTAAWRSGLKQLKQHLPALRERLAAIRANKSVQRFGLATEGTTDFEVASPYAFFRSATADANPRSGRVVDLASQGALAGTHDVRFDFEMANDTVSGNDPASAAPWAVLRLPLVDGTVDLSGVTSVRLLIAADNVRSVRIELDSPKYGIDPEDGARYGKDILIGKQPTEVVIHVADLALPPESTVAASHDDVLAATSALVFSPQAKGRNENGTLPAGKSDAGFLRIDNIRFE